ncbi:MAG: sigma-70 family RNA polymerase sigma factor [Desulfobacteraceae bacterium]|jgi:RNA polymerase sigma-70 factor (ECF subfamily)
MDKKQNNILTVFSEYYGGIYNIFLNKLNCHEDAADGCQETFIRLIRYNDTIEVKSPRAFLFRIAKNLATDMLRRRTVKSGYMESLQQEEEAPEQDDVFNTGMQRQLIKQAISDLPVRCREVFILHHFKNLTYEETAKRLKISPNTVKNHYAKALIRLRKALAELRTP